MTIRVLVVDDSAFVRKALTRVLNQDTEVVVVAQAADGREAIEKVQLVNPDVVTLDLDMPRLGGLATIHELMRIHPVPIIVVSAWAQEGASLAERALELGAVDIVDKTAYARMDIHLLAQELLPKIRAAATAKPRPLFRPDTDGGYRPELVPPAALSSVASLLPMPGALRGSEIVCVGASTGGPQAVQEFLSSLPRGFPLPVVVVQHMPKGFTRLFADRLNALGGLPVREAEQGDRLQPGMVTIAQAGQHITLVRTEEGLRCLLSPFPAHSHVPSVDVLFESAARVCKARTIGVLLTGMGHDGARGMVAIRQAGGLTIGESEETCVVYGMPRAAHEAGGVAHLLPLQKIGWFLLAWLEQRSEVR